MESFRVRHAEVGKERILLLPLSHGASSTVLLHILSQHLKGQVEKTGRTGFKLHVIHVQHAGGVTGPAWSSRLQARYPEHEWSTVKLSDVFAVLDPQEITAALDFPKQRKQMSNETRLSCMLSELGSATSRTDITQILLRKVIVHKAKDLGCEAVLWGDNTTRLAEKLLAESAKGRGSVLPWIIADGHSLHGIPFYYPMRDLLRREIVSLTSLLTPPLEYVTQSSDYEKAVVSAKDTSIDGLMRQYFSSVEQDYPSVVANVVKTSGKLHLLSPEDVTLQCEICDAPLAGQKKERSRLCHGCVRTLQQVDG